MINVNNNVTCLHNHTQYIIKEYICMPGKNIEIDSGLNLQSNSKYKFYIVWELQDRKI